MSGADEPPTVPIVEERPVVLKAEVETGRVKVSTHVEEHDAFITETLISQEVTDRAKWAEPRRRPA